ncbi:MAG: low molecular weight phosphotyrosine protein phosphatase [Clostridia bacterium]|nr:low molecular weight phosphotyrosine protein phosphatase [Clostridia bacterium]
MYKILFVCHGNICRSPMAEFVFNDMAKKNGLENKVKASSAATRTDELGNPVYPPARRILSEHGLDPSGKTARLIKKSDYDEYDLLVCMDDANARDMKRLFGRDDKTRLLMSFAGEERGVADPWWTGDFEETWRDVETGCKALLERLKGEI